MKDWKPEVGQECLLKDEHGCTSTVEITGKGKHGWLVCKVGYSGEGYVPNEKAFFKSIQTERDEQLESFVAILLELDSLSYQDGRKLALRLFEEGCRIIAPDEYVVKPLTDEQIQKIAKQWDGYPFGYEACIEAVQREMGMEV